MTPRRPCARLVAAAVTALALTSGPGGPVPASAATPVPAVPSGLPSAAEPLADYVAASSCDPTAKPGAVALGRLLTKTYSGTSYGISRACGADTLSTTEHYEGRAVDWMNSVRKPKQAAQARAVIRWLTATDAAGTRYANARRLGVMYVIWDNKIWGAYATDRGWRPYSTCSEHPEKSWDSTCHRNHMHLSLSWAGAQRATSYWSKSVAAADYGPCRARDLNWAAPYRRPRATPCPNYPRVSPPAGASARLKTLTTYSGMRLAPGSDNPVVKVVQKALGVKPTSGYYGRVTTKAVKTLQKRHGVPASGVVNSPTWRALLQAEAP